MINKIKASQIEEIKKYLSENSDIYSKAVVFGVCITDKATDRDYIDIAIELTNDSDIENSESLYDLYSKLDDITNGLFNLILINDQYVTENTRNEINTGEIIYESLQ